MLLQGSVPARAAAEGAAASPPSVCGTKKLFCASYLSAPSPAPLLAVHSWTITLTDVSGTPVDGAAIVVKGGMPRHDHGLPTVPVVTAVGGGRYLVEGVKFHMPGDWVVLVSVRAGSQSDTIRFELSL